MHFLVGPVLATAKQTSVAASHLALRLAALLCRQFLFDMGIYGSRKLSAVRASLTLVMEHLQHTEQTTLPSPERRGCPIFPNGYFRQREGRSYRPWQLSGARHRGSSQCEEPVCFRTPKSTAPPSGVCSLGGAACALAPEILQH